MDKPTHGPNRPSAVCLGCITSWCNCMPSNLHPWLAYLICVLVVGFRCIASRLLNRQTPLLPTSASQPLNERTHQHKSCTDTPVKQSQKTIGRTITGDKLVLANRDPRQGIFGVSFLRHATFFPSFPLSNWSSDSKLLDTRPRAFDSCPRHSIILSIHIHIHKAEGARRHWTPGRFADSFRELDCHPVLATASCTVLSF